MRKVRCVNGHDVTGVEGFNCPRCRAEVQTVLRSSDLELPALGEPPALNPKVLMVVGGLVLTLMLGTLVVGPVGQDAFVGGLLISFAALGAAMWVAACALIAVGVRRERRVPTAD